MKNFSTRFKKFTYKVSGYDLIANSEGSNFSIPKIKLAVKQAFSIWCAYAPIIFEEITAGNADISIEFANDGNPTAALGVTSGKSIHINTANRLFIDKENEPERPPFTLIGPFDLIWVLAHEIGHALGIDHPPLVNGVENPPGALMTRGLGEKSVKRQLSSYDIDEIVKRFGHIPLSDTISTDLQQFSNINTSFAGLHFIKESFGIQLDGPVGNEISLYVFMPNTKNRKISSVNLKYSTVLANTFVNSIELYDGIIPIQHFFLNSAIGKGSDQPFKDWEIKLGILDKKKIKNGIFAKINVEFKPIEQLWDVGIVQFKSITADSLFELVIDFPDFPNVGLAKFI